MRYWKVAAVGGAAVVLAAAVSAYPVAGAAALACALAWLAGRRRGVSGLWLVVPVAAAGLAYCAARAALVYADVVGMVKGTAPAWGPLAPEAWLTLDPTGPANLAGRYGLLAGAALGLCAALWLAHGRGAAHSPTRVHGLPVVQSPAKGTSRWAGDADVAHCCEFGPPGRGRYPGGVVLGRLQGRIVRVIPGKAVRGPGLAGHAAVFGATGAGKSFSFVRPNIVAAAEAGESLVVTDPKGELCADVAKWLQERGYLVRVFNLADPAHSHRWNPVAECRDEEEVTALAMTVVVNAAREKSGYFLMKETQLLEALVFLLNADFPEEHRHLRAALSLCAWPQEELDARFERAYRAGRLPLAGYERWRGAVASNYDNAVSGLTAKLKVICTAPVAALLSEHELDLADVGRRKTALFCVLPIGGGHLRPVLAAFYWFLFRRLRQAAEENGGRLPVPVRFLLDEFANIGQVPGFPEIISTARSQGVMVQFVLQGLRQLDEVYGSADAENILANCPIRLLLGCNDIATARYFSALLGEAAVQSVSERQDVSTPLSGMGLPKRTLTTVRRALMEPEELMRLKAEEAVAVVQGCLPMFLEKLGWHELPQAREVKAAGQASPAQFVGQRDLDVPLPEIPKGGSRAPDRPDRRRGGERMPGIDALFLPPEEPEEEE